MAQRVELGRHIVADPLICHGKPTFKGTRIMVWQVLDALARGETWDEIVKAWGGRVSKEAIAETIQLVRDYPTISIAERISSTAMVAKVVAWSAMA